MIEGVLQVSEMQVRDIMVPRVADGRARHRDDPPEQFMPLVIEIGPLALPGDRRGPATTSSASCSPRTCCATTREAEERVRRPRDAAAGRVHARDQAAQRAAARSSAPAATTWRSWSTNTAASPGLVTIEDVLEQIVGDIEDEYDFDDDQPIRREGATPVRSAGTDAHRRIQRVFGTEFTDDEFDTIGGLHHCTSSGACRAGARSVTVDGFEFRVLRADRRRIDTLRVTTPRDIPTRVDE